MRHAEWHGEWPQTGERIPNHVSDVAIHLNYPGYPGHTIKSVEGHGPEWMYLNALLPGYPGRWVRISGGGDTWFAEITLTYPDSTWLGVVACEVKGDRIWKETAWFCPTDVSIERRDRLTVPMGEVQSGFHESSGSPADQKRHERTLDRFYSSLASGVSPSEVLSENTTIQFPQTFDAVRGRSDISDLYSSSPIRTAVVHQRWVLGGSALVELRTPKPDGAILHLIHFDGDQISRISDYWAPKLDAPSWRAEFVEPI